MPVVLTALVAIVIAAAFGALSLHTRTRMFPARAQQGTPGAPHDITSYVTSMVGVGFALTVGLALVSVWANRDAAIQNSRIEASGLHEVYLLAANLPPTAREQIQGEAAAYAHYVETVEWPLMQRGDPLPETGFTMLTALHHAVTSYQPTNTAQIVAITGMDNQLGAVDAASLGRRGAASTRLPALLWVGLVLGATLTLVLALAHYLERQLDHLAMIVSLTSMLGFIMILIYILNNPFTPGFGAGPGAFTAAFPTNPSTG
jgi:hypothetical protein